MTILANPGEKILYRAASGLEKAMADSDVERLIATYAEAVKDVWNPDAIPLHLLPYLAWAMGVELWRDGWVEATKREWVKRQWEFKSLRGTRAGLEMAVDFMGRDVTPFGWFVKKVITQPQGFYASVPISQADYQVWLDSLPEIRLYRMHAFDNANNIASVVDGDTNDFIIYTTAGLDPEIPPEHQTDLWTGISAGDPLSLADAYRRYAVMVDNGIETELAIEDAGSLDKKEIETFYFPHHEHLFYSGAFADNGFARPGGQELDYVAAIRRTGELEWWNLMHHGAEVTSGVPRNRYHQVPDSAHIFAGADDINGGNPAGIYASDAFENDKYVFESWRIAARGRVSERNSVVSYADYSLVSFPAYTAEVTVDVRERSAHGYMFSDTPAPIYYATPYDPFSLDPLWDAVNVSRALRDRVLVDTAANLPQTIDTAPTLDDLML